MALAAEIVVRAYYGAGIGEVELGHEHQECQRVVETADEEHTPTLLNRQILIQKEQVIAEVEIGFPRIGCRKASSSKVIHAALRHYLYGIAFLMDEPEQVDSLHVRKKVLVEPADCKIHVGAHHQSRPCRPEYFYNVVVLSTVFLHGVENAPAAIGVAVLVDESSGSPGIFELAAVGLLQQFGLACRHIAMGLHILVKRPEPFRRHFYIRIEKQRVFVAQLLYGAVIALGIAVVFREIQCPDFRKLRLE